MKTIKVGIAGLGRLGKVHANNIAFKIPNAQLTAACSIMPAELEYAKTELGVTDVYTDFREMLEKADIDAVAIVTTSSEHCWQIEAPSLRAWTAAYISLSERACWHWWPLLPGPGPASGRKPRRNAPDPCGAPCQPAAR